MAEKMSVLVVTIDLQCCECDKKIRKTLCKFPEIQNQKFDEKNNKVFIAGPFDPEKMKKKLCCKAGKYIKTMEVLKPEPPAPKPKPDSEPTKPAPDPVKPPLEATKSEPVQAKPEPKGGPQQAKPKPEPTAQPPKVEPEAAKPIPDKKKSEPTEQPVDSQQAKKVPTEVKPPPPQPSAAEVMFPAPGMPVGPYGPVFCWTPNWDDCHAQPVPLPYGPRVCCRPCYDGYPEHGICRQYGYESGYRFFSEEDNTACTIM